MHKIYGCETQNVHYVQKGMINYFINFTTQYTELEISSGRRIEVHYSLLCPLEYLDKYTSQKQECS